MTQDTSPACRETEAAPAEGGLRLSASGERIAGAAADEKAAGAEGGAAAAFLTPAARGRLTSALLVKGALDLLFVASLAVAAHYLAFKPYFRGVLDKAARGEVAGWVFDRSSPDGPVRVQLYVNGEFVASGLADQSRPDVRAAGLSPHDRVGFVFRLNPPRAARSEARVYAVNAHAGGERRTLQQIGGALIIDAE